MNPLKRFELFLSYDAAFVSKTFLTLSQALLLSRTGETEIKTGRLLSAKTVQCHFQNWYPVSSLMYVIHLAASKIHKEAFVLFCVWGGGSNIIF